jgi:hypothetical protein
MPPLPPPKAPPKNPTGNGHAVASPTRTLGVSRGVTVQAQKIVNYGPGGIGKSELCSLLKNVGIEPLFIDIEDSSKFLDVQRIDPTPRSWDELRSVLHNIELLKRFGAVVIDSLTKGEELGIEWTLANVKHEKGHYVNSIEGYGFGKGYMHVYETFLQLLGDLDAVIRAGVHVVCTCHDCTANVPNPAGEDWIRYEPRLQAPPSGKGSIRSRVKEWADHLLYIGYDTHVGEDCKAKGSGTRCIYPVELPTWLAKSRSLADPIPYTKGDSTLWQKLFTKE